MSESRKIFTPSFTRGTIDNIKRMINSGKITPPLFGFATDLQCIIYYDIDKKLYLVNIGRIEAIEDMLSDIVDPDTGEPIKVTEYVDDTLQPVKDEIEEVKQNVGTINVVI